MSATGKRTQHLVGRVSYRFHAVGQGLFASGRLNFGEYIESADDFRTFGSLRWVYDCGSQSSHPTTPRILQGRIAEYRSESGEEKIPLVFVSHFDKDHINGLGDLLGVVSVDYLVLPWIPLERRIEIAIIEGALVGTNEFLFIVDPIAYISSNYVDQVGALVFVLPSSGQGAPSLEGTLFGTDDYIEAESDQLLSFEFEEGSADVQWREEWDLDLNRNVSFRDKVYRLKDGGRISYLGLYEFVPYNDERYQPCCPREFVAEVKKHQRQLLERTSSEACDKIFEQLKEIYEAEFKVGESRNGISLFVCGMLTIANYRCCRTHVLRTCAAAGGCDMLTKEVRHQPCTSSSTGCGILYTGDGIVDTSESLQALTRYMKDERMRAVELLQVMHHGSRHNFFPGISAELHNRISVFSSNPDHKTFQHPHPEVLREFMLKGPVCVTKDSDYELVVYWERLLPATHSSFRHHPHYLWRLSRKWGDVDYPTWLF